MEEEEVRLYHSLENSREYHEFEPQYISIGAQLAPAVEYLLDEYPNYVQVEDLPLGADNLDDKMEIANLLYDKGLVTVVQSNENSDSESMTSDDK
jgi:lysine-specific demethylase/histidyl-hydroxylase NO66